MTLAQEVVRCPLKSRGTFNPLAALRLLCALGPTVEQVRITSRFVFERGGDPSTPEGMRDLGKELGVTEPEALASDSSVKDKLRHNTAEALGRGIWGVPTFLVGEMIFWGADSFPMMLDYLRDPGIFETPEMQRLVTLPVGASRT